MSAPATEKATEQTTQPLQLEPTRITERSWLMSEAAEVLIPVTILAAIGAGTLLRNYVLVTDLARSNFAIIVLLVVVAVSGGVVLCGRGRGRRERNFLNEGRRS